MIGGGITGAGIARDIALRGVKVTLIEKRSPASSATGRCHGLLHSGARYAVKDPGSAAECARENMVLKEIAPESIDDTGGIFLGITEDDVVYGEKLRDACRAANIPMEEVSPAESPNPDAIKCYATNDARVDPFLLTLSNLYDARINGATIITGRDVAMINSDGVTLGDGQKIKGEIVINATGYECAGLLNQSGLRSLLVQPNKGTILVTERRVCDTVVNRMRPPSNGDIVVPCHTTSLIGTTSSNSTSDVPVRQEYKDLIREAIQYLPSIKGARVIRAFSGVRPLLGSGDGRNLSRDYQVFRENNVISVAGGKLTTYRLIAERVSDEAMSMLGERGGCRTNTRLPDILNKCDDRAPICLCESMADRLIDMDFLSPGDRAKFNRIGFGACQGMRCSGHHDDREQFLQERWKGVKPVINESQVPQSYLSWAVYKSRMGL